MKTTATVSLIAFSLLLWGCNPAPEEHHDNDKNHKHEHDNDKGHDHDKDHDKGHDNDKAASKPTSKPTVQPQTGMTRMLDGQEFQFFGLDIEEGKAMTAAELAANKAKYDGKEVVVKGKMSAYCKAAGCWYTVGEGANEIMVNLGHDKGMEATKSHMGKTAIAKGKVRFKKDRITVDAAGFGVSDG